MKGLFGNPNNEKNDRSIFNNAAPIKNSLFPSIHNNDCLFPKNSLFPSIHNNDGLFVDIPRNISFRFDDNNNNKYDLFAPYNDYNQGNSLFFNNNHHGTVCLYVVITMYPYLEIKIEIIIIVLYLDAIIII